MAIDLRFLIKYWCKHKHEMVAIIVSAIFLVVMLLVSGYLERTEIRRELHSYYDIDGAFDVEYRNVDSDTISFIKSSETVDCVGKIRCIGKIETGEFSATVGGFLDEETESLAHYPISEGRLPESKGEIAITRDVLNEISPLSEVGDDITLDILTYKSNENKSFDYKIVGIFEDFNRATFEDPINGYDFCDPRIILSKDETDIFPEGYTNLMFQFKNGEKMALSSDDELYAPENDLTHECFVRGYSRSGTGRAHGIQIIAMSNDEDNIETSSKLKMVELITVFGIIISIISMISSLIVVLQNRSHSFYLMRCVGYSKLRIIRLLFIEMSIFFICSTVLGVCFGFLLYEGLFRAQVSFFDLPSYKGYYTEWIVEQKTISPLPIALIVAFITIFISYLTIILKLLFSLNSSNNSKKYWKHFNIRSVYSGINRILSQKGTIILQVISLSSIIFVCVIGYLYCTPIGKGNTVVSQTSLNQNSNNGIYEVLEGIDLKKEGYDALLESTSKYSSAAYLAPYINYGISESDLDAMLQNGISQALCWSDRFDLVIGIDNHANDTILSNSIPDDYCKILGYEQNSLAALPCILVNDELLSEFYTICKENIDTDGAVWISVYGDGNEFNGADTYSVYSFQADSTGWLPENSMSCALKIVGSMKLDTSVIETNNIITNVINELKNYPGFLLVTGKYADKLGIYNHKYDKALIYGNSNENTVKTAVASISTEAGLINATTIFNLKKKAVYDFVFDYLSIIILFVLLFVIYIIGFSNVLKMSLKMKSHSFSVIRCLGLKRTKLTKYILISNLKIPLISSFFSGISIIIYRLILKNKYSAYCDLIDKRDQLYNAYGKEEELIAVKSALSSLKNKYLLAEEMWVPDWFQVFIILSCFITIFIIITVCVILNKQYTHNLKTELSEMNRE